MLPSYTVTVICMLFLTVNNVLMKWHQIFASKVHVTTCMFANYKSNDEVNQ